MSDQVNATPGPAKVSDYETREALLEAIYTAAVELERDCDVKYGSSGITDDTIRSQVVDYLAAVDDRTEHLSADRCIEDIPLDVIEWVMDRAFHSID